MASRQQVWNIVVRGGLASAALAAAACCPSKAGPTAPAATYTITLGPGQLQFFDADTPSSTTQINLTFRIDLTDAPVQLRQIDPGCQPAPEDTCRTYYDATMPPRSAGVVQFGNSLQPHGQRTRIVLRNPSQERAITISLTIAPHRAGCT